MEPNIFAGDELMAMLCQDCILIGGPELQQECFFCELSALASLEPPKKACTEHSHQLWQLDDGVPRSKQQHQHESDRILTWNSFCRGMILTRLSQQQA